MESLWNNIEQCEKRLDDMDGQQDQVDSATSLASKLGTNVGPDRANRLR